VHPGYFPVFFWSLTILVSFWGYGELLRRRINRPEFADIGWGLTCAWGMAVVLALGGILMAFHLAKAPVLTAVVLFGAAGAAFYLAERVTTKPNSGNLKSKTKNPKSDSSAFIIHPSTLILYCLAVLALASSIAWPHHIDPNDDLVCYLMLPEKILATGTLIEPFSFQRAGTFGGQSLLQALVMIVGAEKNGHVPDRGLAMAMLLGIFLHSARGLKGQELILHFAIVFALLFVPVPRISTNGAMVGGCMIVALLASLELAMKSPRPHWKSLLPAGLLTAGISTIRPTFAFVAAAIILALATRDVIALRKSPGGPLAAFKPYFIVGVICVLVVIPYAAVLYSSNGTPLIPPFSGFVSKAYQTYSHQTLAEDVHSIMEFLKAPQTLGILALYFAAWMFPGTRTSRWVIGAIFVSAFYVLYRFTAIAYLDQYRYLYPVFVPAVLWMLCERARRGAEQAPNGFTPCLQRPPPGLLVPGVALIAFLAINAPQGFVEIREQVVGLPRQIQERRSLFDPRIQQAYQHLQSLVPPGEKILTMVDASYWFDFKRNPIFSINAVGGSSPPPGIPFEKGPEALSNYLKGLGIRYVIAVDFNNAVLLYTRSLWTERTRPEWFYPKLWRPRFLDFMDNIDYLDSHGARLSQSANARLLDLGY
jgi:hypothetical protein